MSSQNSIEYTKHDESTVFIDYNKVYDLVENITNDFKNISRDLEEINNIVVNLLNNPSTKGRWHETLVNTKKSCLNKLEINRISSRSLENKLANTLNLYVNKVIKTQENITNSISNFNKD